MARGWGSAPPDLKGTLGTLLRTTLIQIGALRDAAVRELRSGSLPEKGREWASRGVGLLRPQRTQVLASLGEIIYELALAGELDLDDFPELRDAISALEAIDNEVAEAGGFERIDRSSAAAAPRASGGSPGVWRPDPGDYTADGQRLRDDVPTPPQTGRPTRPARQRVEGHIAFVPDDASLGSVGSVDDEDLAEYMHPDDVPETKPAE